MKLKSFLAMCCMSVLPMASMADDTYKYLTVAHDDIEESLELSTIRKITFEGGNTIITTDKGNFTYPSETMKKIYFDMSPTAIEVLPEQTKGLSYDGESLTVNNLNRNGLVRIYLTSGMLKHVVPVQQSGKTKISLKNLPTGIYIIAFGNDCIKINK